nr:MAG TPA: immunity protein [Caudoviricetes sp.]
MLFEFHWEPSRYLNLSDREKALIIELVLDEAKKRDEKRKEAKF